MCISDGSPDNPLQKDKQKQAGMQELWDLLSGHDAVFLGNEKLKEDLDALLTRHDIKRQPVSTVQEKNLKVIEKLVKKGRLVC